MPGRCCRPATCPARPRPWPPASRAPDTWRRTRGCRGRSPGGSGAPWRPPARAPPRPRSGSTRRHPHTAAWARGHEMLGVVTIHLAQTIHTNVKALEALVRAFSVIVNCKDRWIVCSSSLHSPPGGGTDLWSLPWPRSAWQVAVRARAQASQSLEATRLLTCPEHWEKQSSCNYIDAVMPRSAAAT